MTSAALERSHPNALHTALLAAHDAGDGRGLVALYTEAADREPEMDAEMFFLTQAYIFALEAGDPRAAGLRARLRAAGRI
ncbi:MAG: hypothetical protein AAFQ54_14270 [Pseudomonadota bacterium]